MKIRHRQSVVELEGDFVRVSIDGVPTWAFIVEGKT